MRRVLILIAAVALLTAACKIETNFDATLNPDGSGTVSAEIGLDEEAEGFLSSQGQLPGGEGEGDAPFDPFEDAPPGATTRTEERGDMTFYIVTQEFSSADELAALATEDDGLFETFAATFSDTRVTVRGTTADAGAGLTGGEDLGGFDPALLEDSFSANIRITMPGKVIDSNADIVDGSTLTWEVPLFAGGAVEIQAQSDPTQSAGGFPIWAIVVIVVVAAAALGALVWWLRQRSSTAPAADETTDAAPPQQPAASSDEAPEHDDESPPPPTP